MGYDMVALMAAQSRSVSIPPYQVFVAGTHASAKGALGQEVQPQTRKDDLCGSHVFLDEYKVPLIRNWAPKLIYSTDLVLRTEAYNPSKTLGLISDISF